VKYASLRAKVIALRMRDGAAETALAAERTRAARARDDAAELYEAVWPVVEAAHAIAWTLPDPARGAPVPVDRVAYESLRVGLRELARGGRDDGEGEDGGAGSPTRA
jgi:hypothetical protein